MILLKNAIELQSGRSRAKVNRHAWRSLVLLNVSWWHLTIVWVKTAYLKYQNHLTIILTVETYFKTKLKKSFTRNKKFNRTYFLTSGLSLKNFSDKNILSSSWTMDGRWSENLDWFVKVYWSYVMVWPSPDGPSCQILGPG